jgi:hypothetical protein
MPLAIAAKLVVAALAATPATTDPPRDPGYAPLENLIGEWTTVGSEDTFRETCEWYHGRFHVVCHSTRKREDGTMGHGMSILGFMPGAGYVYTGIGNRGRYETLEKGTFADGVLEYRSTATDDGKTVVTRIRVGPAHDGRMPFVVDTSTDGGAWSEPDTTMYVRIR